MSQLLVTDDNHIGQEWLADLLGSAGYEILTARSGQQGLELLSREAVDLVLSDLRLPDMSGLEFLRHVRARADYIPLVFVTASSTTREAVTAMQLGAANFLEKPISEATILETVAEALASPVPLSRGPVERRFGTTPQAHAVTRLARVLMPVLDSPRDLRTLADWSQMVFMSPGALRNWCRMAGYPPRQWLVFVRMLRAVWLCRGGQCRPEHLLDAAGDRRTLVGLLRFAGISPKTGCPNEIEAFLHRQSLVRDRETLAVIRRALAARQQHP